MRCHRACCRIEAVVTCQRYAARPAAAQVHFVRTRLFAKKTSQGPGSGLGRLTCCSVPSFGCAAQVAQLLLLTREVRTIVRHVVSRRLESRISLCRVALLVFVSSAVL